MFLNRRQSDGTPPLLDRLTLPEPVSTKIFLLLDGSSLHQARQVCKEWNQFILEQVWGSISGRREQERKLEERWDLVSPTVREETVTVEEGATIVKVIEDYVVSKVSRTTSELVEGEEGPPKKRRRKSSWWEVTITASLIVHNWRTGESVELELGGQDHVSLAGVHLVKKQARTIIIAVLRGNHGIMGWDLGDQKMLFQLSSFNYGESLLDQASQEIVVFGGFQSNTWDSKLKRLKISEAYDLSVKVYDLPAGLHVTKGLQYNELRGFSSPFLLTKSHELSIVFILWRFGDSQIERVSVFACSPLQKDCTLFERYLLEVNVDKTLMICTREEGNVLSHLYYPGPMQTFEAFSFGKERLVILGGSSLVYSSWNAVTRITLIEDIPDLPSSTRKSVEVNKTNILMYQVKKDKRTVSLIHFNFWN